MSNILNLHTAFNTAYSVYNTLLSDSTILYQSKMKFEDTIYNESIHSAIVEYCFMHIFLSWEAFLEGAFIAYLNNATDLQDKTYHKYGIPINDEHAYEMITGTKRYPDWTNIDEVNKLAKIFFENSGPFICLSSNPIELQDIKTIRNIISHSSTQSQERFNRLLTKTITKTTGITISNFLITMKNNSSCTYYSFYTETLKNYVDSICNSPV